MRIASFVLLSLLAAPALAQEPDTTAAWRYFPLAVGNVWEYRCVGDFDFETERRAVVGDTTVSDTLYFRYRIERFDASGQPNGAPTTSLVRFNTLSATVETRSGLHPIFVTPCPLNAAFGDEMDCVGFWGLTEAWGGTETLHIGPDSLWTTVKTYDCGGCEQIPGYAAGIGLARAGSLYGTYTLEYALVSGVTYGEPIVLSAEPASPSSDLAFTAYPNPTHGVATLALTVPVPQTVTVEVFDVLGRRVYREAHAAAGVTSLRLDGRAWKPGIYVVRVSGASGQATVRVVRR